MRRLTCLAVFAALALVPAQALAVKGGILDPGFGSGGFTSVNTSPPMERESANAMVVDSKNRVLVGGTLQNNNSSDPESGWQIVRLTSEGKLDTSYGVEGIARAPGLFGPELGSSSEELRALAPVPGTDKVIAGGTQIGPSTKSEFTVARYNEDGSLDLSFGPGDTGFVTADLGSSTASLDDIAVSADGSITAVGSAGLEAALVRWDSDGALDPAFDGPGAPGNGKFIDSLSTGFDDFRNVLVEPSGAVRAVGVASIGPQGNWLIAHYSPTGARETSFNGGFVITDFEGQSDLGADQLLLDETLYVFGAIDVDPGSPTRREFAVVGFDPVTGVEYGGTRTQIPLPESRNLFAATLQRLGGSPAASAERLLLAGGGSTLVRLRRAAGSTRAFELDPEFGDSGFAPKPDPVGNWRALAVDGQSRLLVAGNTGNFESADLTAARFVEEVPGGARDTTAPLITGASVSPRAWALKPRGAAEVPLVRRPKRGTTFSYTLSEPARVAFLIERRVRGRRAGGKCRKATSQNSRKPRCARFVAVGTFAQGGALGPNRKPFGGRIGRKKLRPAPYRATLTATDPAGNASIPTRLSFKIVRSKRR